MSSNGAEPVQKSLPSRRARHQITRSITELSPPVKLRHRHHKHPPHSSKHHRQDPTTTTTASTRHRTGKRLQDDRVPLSAGGALQHLGRSSLDATQSEFVSPIITPHPSRTASLHLAGGDHHAMFGLPIPTVKARNVEEELAAAKEQATIRIGGLKKCLADLGEFSNTTTRQLDDSYYAVLEKTSLLQNTITAIKELTTMSREIKSTFDKESADMVKDVQGQLDSFGEFGESQRRIESLQNRIDAGRTKIQSLSKRVDVVKERMECWERADREWQARTRKRIKVVWIVMSIIVAILFLLFLAAKYAAPGLPHESDNRHVPNNVSTPFFQSGVEESNLSRGPERPPTEENRSGEPGLPLWRERKPEQEDQLRFLDEL